MSVYRRALASYRPFLWPTVVAAGVNAAAILLGLLRPWPFACIVDGVLPMASGGVAPADQPLASMAAAGWSAGSMILALCGIMVLIHLASGVLGLISGVMFLRVGLQALLRLRTELYACLHALPLKFHDQRRSADSSFRVAYDSQSIQTFYAKSIFLFQSSFSIVSTFVVMWQLDWQLTLLSLGVVPLMWLVLMRYAKRIRAESTHIAERESAVLTVAQEGLSSIRMVQAFGREEHEVAQFRSSARQSMEATLRLNFVSMKSALIVSTLIAASTAAMYWLGSNHVFGGTLKLGELIWISSLLILLYQPLESLTQIAWALESAAASAARCFEVLDRQDDVPDAPDARALHEVRGEVTFEKVSFGYDEKRLILRDINLHLAPGQTVAFVGGTGAGKSTLLSLVPRFYDPTGGRILIDGQDLRSVTKKSLRQHISMVLQDTLLFSTTIRENIAYGRPDATEEEIIEAAKRAQAHEFIMAMPEGYCSQVGERGGHLSVGQRQRIGIARAFLKNAPLLILDEPTSALDPTTESAIMTTLDSLMRGRTTFIITHRIATIHGVDQIVVLGDCGIVETGSGPELIKRGGAYATLHSAATVPR